jgi:DNA-binding NarL/FixJ family response regulator
MASGETLVCAKAKVFSASYWKYSSRGPIDFFKVTSRMGLKNATSPFAPSARRARVIVADPYPVILLGVRKMVEDDARFQVVAEVSTMPSFWEKVVAERPEAALLDCSLAAQDLEITSALLRSVLHPTSIIFFTVSEDSQQKQDMLRLGAQAFLSKSCSAENLRTAVSKACNEPVSYPPATAKPGADSFPAASFKDPAQRIKQLSKRERQVLPLVCSGLKNKEIAFELGIAESTVWHHLTAVFTKLQVEDRMGLAAFAYSHGLVLPAAQSVPVPSSNAGAMTGPGNRNLSAGTLMRPRPRSTSLNSWRDGVVGASRRVAPGGA